MGKNKKGFNWKARKNPKTEIDNRAASKIQVDFKNQKGNYDECNQLVLPSKKRPTKEIKSGPTVGKILSKTQRKKLQKIVDKKLKKSNRATLLEALASVQVPASELDQLTSIASVQTKGLKRHFIELENGTPVFTPSAVEEESKTLNSVSGSKRRRRILAAILNKTKTEKVNDDNVVGFNNSSSDESNDEDIADDENENGNESDNDNDDGGRKYNANNANSKEKIKNEEEIEIEEIGEINEHQESEDEEVEELGKINNLNDRRKTLKKKHKESTLKNVKVENITDSKEAFDSGSVKETESLVKENKEKQKVQPAVFVPVFRKTEIQEGRLKLPILAEEQMIMEMINENSITIVAGETGSGKTTQIPQFLYEAGYARDKMIGVTQPRRVAAISMSKRVAEEMNLGCDVVSFLIRFEGNVTPETKIKFMTDGVLLKEIQSDFTLSKYSVIILDEAHERSIYTDILIGLLSRIVPIRNKKGNPLKLIIMSATLRVEDFTENSRLFKSPPPVIKVESRQYPVSVHFNKRTSSDYLKECYNKTCKIHSQLPEGGILIFVTGQQEVKFLVKKLRRTFPFDTKNRTEDVEKDLNQSLKVLKKSRKGKNITLPEINLDKYSVIPTDDTEGDLLADEGAISDEEEDDISEASKLCKQPMWVLPLYSLLRSSEQAKVFQKPPPGCRLCIVSTNVAETSLTIPNIKYVVDSGRTKTRLYDKVTGVSAFHVTWCSKASANQRAGRAGRMGPGHCYRLYSSAVFNDQFDQFSIPEIQQKPVDDLLLQMKSMNIVKVINFPFPTAPDILQLKAAEKRLTILGALESNTKAEEWCSKLTKLGESMASFPVSPRFAKMLALSYQHNLLQYTISIVAALSVQEVLIENQADKKWFQLRRLWAGSGNSLLLGDVRVLLHAVGAAECSKSDLEEFCSKNGLRHKAIIEIRKLRVQLTNQINLNIPNLNLAVDPDMKPPTDTQARLLRQIILAGMADQVAHKVSQDEVKVDEDKRKWKRAYRCCEMEEPVFLHSASVLKNSMPEWIVYQEVFETNKLYVRGITGIEPEWLPIFVPALCNLSEPLSEPPPRYDSQAGKVYCHVNGTFGKAAFELPTMEIPYVVTMNSFKWFAAYFLNGDVFPKLKKYTPTLLSSPFTTTKSWFKLQSRTELILNALTSKEVNTRDLLLDVWKQDSYYLLNEYKLWLPQAAHDEVTLLWPPT